MPRNTFVAGEVLTAAEMNSVADQTVMTFAGTAARGSAIASPSEGMVSYLDDSNQLEVYDGSNWVGLAGASVGTATPASTAEGDFWLDTNPDGQVLKAYNSGWKNVGPVSNNAVINGDFGVWQRGTSVDVSGPGGYAADRWQFLRSSAYTGATFSRESFTPADIEAIGYGDAEFFGRVTITDKGTGISARFVHRIEDVRTLAGQPITLSFWAKSSSAFTMSAELVQSFGSGGSSNVDTSLPSASLTTGWQRFSLSVSVPSVSGKTIGSSSYVELRFFINDVDGESTDLWGVQLEAGSVATPFRPAGGGSKAAELALCQRYYYRVTSEANRPLGVGLATTTTTGHAAVFHPVTMRTPPTQIEFSNIQFTDYVTYSIDASSVTINAASEFGARIVATVASGLTQFRPGVLITKAGGHFALDAEL